MKLVELEYYVLFYLKTDTKNMVSPLLDFDGQSLLEALISLLSESVEGRYNKTRKKIIMNLNINKVDLLSYYIITKVMLKGFLLKYIQLNYLL